MKRPFFLRLSLGQRLPLIIFLLLLSIILIFGITSYIGVSRAELNAGEDRLKVLSEQLSSMLTGNTHSMVASAKENGNTQHIINYVKTNGADNSSETIEDLNELRKDTGYLKAEIKNADFQTIYSSAKNDFDLNVSLDTILTKLSNTHDTAFVGQLYKSGDAVYYPIVSTIFENNKTIGYLVRWRMMSITAPALAQLRKLLGSGASLFVGNKDGKIWSDLQKAISPVPSFQQIENNVIHYQRNSEKVIAHIRPIVNSQWLVAVELSKKEVLGAANQFLKWLILIGSILLIIGVLVAWLMVRKITDPLQKLTTAVSGIAAGNYSTLSHLNRYDELGKLARAFNAMSAQVQDAQKTLESKAQNYRLLFEGNPMPMWIISKSTLEILNVNQAAVEHYGYTLSEFLALNSKDLRPEEDHEKYVQFINDEKNIHANNRGIWRHKKKDGTIIMVDVTADNIIYHDQPARLILANDVTEKLNAEAQLVRHRVMQQELISETTLQVQEKAREELGKELHDNINQILASTKLYLEMAKGGNAKLVQEAIDKSYDNVNLAIMEIRRLSKQLVAPALETSLVDVIKDLSEEIQAITPINTSLIIDNFHEHLLNDNLKLVLYRIIQEQVNNILKHAAASDVHITIATEHGIVYLIIWDNGIGFDTAKKSKGIGLRNIDSRVKFYDGEVNLTSQPGKGTRLEISVPLERKTEMVV